MKFIALQLPNKNCQIPCSPAEGESNAWVMPGVQELRYDRYTLLTPPPPPHTHTHHLPRFPIKVNVWNTIPIYETVGVNLIKLLQM